MKKHDSLMPGSWHKSITFTVLLILVSSAIPTFLGSKETLKISGMTSIEAQSQSPTLSNLLNDSLNISVIASEHIDSNGQALFELVLNEKVEDAVALQKVIQSELTLLASVKLSNKSAAPSWLSSIAAEPIKLGLDLSGGALFVLEVDTLTATNERFKAISIALKTAIREARVYGARVSYTPEIGINIHTPHPANSRLQPVLNTFISQYDGLYQSTSASGDIVLQMSKEQKQLLSHQYVEQALTTMRSRIEQLGITEGVVQRQGTNRIRIEIPGIKDLQQAERLIGATASLAFHQYAEFAPGKSRLSFTDNDHGNLNLASQPIFTGNNISDAQMGRDEHGMPLVNLVLDTQGGDKMSAFSRKNIGKPMVTIFSEYQLDSNGQLQKSQRVINIATIQAQLGNRFSITNLKSVNEAHDLALLLRAGSLDAPVTIVEKRVITASLGEQNVKNGMLALGVGLALTLAFMLLCYRRLGMIANLALLFNLASLTGLMALTPNAVLTLPGIAGLVLTVGMAVDTNVLIFERILQERKKGVPPNLAMILGYKRAWTTILDANLTTLICALVMLSIGYGPVKGFAITLCLGLITSVFTGVALSKTLSAYIPATWLLNAKGARS